MSSYQMTNNFNERHINGLKRMNVAMEIYSLETDLGHYKLASTLIIVNLVITVLIISESKSIFSFCFCVLPEVSFQILTPCYIFLTAITKVEAAATTPALLTISYVPGPLLRAIYALCHLILSILF